MTGFNDPMWKGGGAVCGHSKTSAPSHAWGGSDICGCCGHPKSWHRDGEPATREEVIESKRIAQETVAKHRAQLDELLKNRRSLDDRTRTD